MTTGLMLPPTGLTTVENISPADTSSVGVTITCPASANTKSSPWSQLIASTARDIAGLMVMVGNTHVAATRTNVLVDIGIGAASSESVLIADLIAGYGGIWGGAARAVPHVYYFPLFIPAGTRMAARAQAIVVSDTVDVAVVGLSRPLNGGNWVGSQVHTYGAINSGNTKGTDVTAGNNAYGSAVNMTASSTHRTRYLQLGIDGATDNSLSDFRGLARISAGGQSIIEGLPFNTEGAEYVNEVYANLLLSNCAFDIPAASALAVSLMINGSTNNVLSCCLYAVH